MQQLQATRIQREETFSGSCESDSQVVPVSSLRNKLVRFHKKKNTERDAPRSSSNDARDGDSDKKSG